MQRLFRKKIEGKIAGVCSGLGYYTNTDPVVWRIIFVALLFSPIPITLIYLLAWWIIPKEKQIVK